MGVRRSADARLEQVIALLHGVLAQVAHLNEPLAPWRESYVSAPRWDERISATDRLSLWFRPTADRENPWDSFFDGGLDPFPDLVGAEPRPPVRAGYAGPPAASQAGPAPVSQTPSHRSALRLLLAEPEEEMLDADAESVVTCLYDFVHALGRQDVEAAMACVAPDYHTLEDDREVDRGGLAGQIRALLDSFHGWAFEVSLVEIPQPILYPEAILVYIELLIDARRPDDDSRRTILERRIAVFKQQRDRSWLIAALSPV